MQSSVPRVCIVVLSGIPGSGKTFLGQELKRCLLSRNDDTHAVIVEYDQILNDSGARTFKGSDDCAAVSPWRSARKEIAECVRALVESVVTAARSFFDAVSQHVSPPGSTISCRFSDLVAELVPLSCTRLAIIVDDNMYYRSMRYEYYIIAKSYGVGFAEVHLDVPVSIAMARNSKRKESVPEDIIINMAARIEPPDVKYGWEWNCCTVHNDGSRPSWDLITAVCVVVNNGFVNPVTTKATISASSLTAMHSADESVIHQADIVLRKLVSDHVASTKRSGAGNDILRQAARLANEARQHLLGCLKNGDLYLPDFTATVEDSATLPTYASEDAILASHGLASQPWQSNLTSLFHDYLAFGK